LKYKKVFYITISVILALAGLSACTKKSLEYEKKAIHEDMTEDSAYGKIDMKFRKLDGEDIRTFKAEKGKIYEFIYKYQTESGELSIQFADSKGNILDSLPDGSETKKKDDSIRIGEIGGIIDVESPDEQMKIIITGNNAEGYINITW